VIHVTSQPYLIHVANLIFMAEMVLGAGAHALCHQVFQLLVLEAGCL
jgi:hypothetical protein